MKHKAITLFCCILIGATAALPQSTSTITLNSTPSREVGQPKLIASSANPNLVEGRELWSPQSIAFDTSVTPAIVYVSDVGNNRILAWKNATSFQNGQPADLVIGQPDKYSTSQLGPGSQYTTGVNSPGGIAVSKSGDLYVADTGNNRVVRYAKPFAQTGPYPITNLYVGQPSNTSKVANYPTGSTNNTGLSSPTSVALDSSGNLWVVDSGNRRVIEFLASSLTDGSAAPQATLELGQVDLSSLQKNLDASQTASQTVANQFAVPSSLAFDSAGRLYVSDADLTVSVNFGRVLVFEPPFANGQSAKRIIGVVQGSQVTAATAQGYTDKIAMRAPAGIFFLADDSVGVADVGSNRLLLFPPYSQWSTDTASLFSPTPSSVIGQNNFHNRGANGTTSTTAVTPPANQGVFTNPVAAAFLPATNELFVADAGNNRVLVLPSSGNDTFGNATRVLGQDKFTMSAPNLIEGREFDFITANTSGSLVADAGITLDTTGKAPHMYVADPYNHRVLGFYDIRKMAPGGKADIVIGQPDFNSSLCNYPSGEPTQMSAQSLCYPRAVLTDPQGNLYVSDSQNGRVLRFPAPFGQCPDGPGSTNCTLPALPTADLVLGQASFNGIPIKDPSAANMRAPYGLAFSGSSGLVVADDGDNRVLFFPFNNGTTFAAGLGPVATKVLGQPDFVTITSGSGNNKLNSPHHIACDTSGQVYVADSGNNRVVIFSDPNSPLTPATNASYTLQLPNLSSPRGIYVNPTTGEVWVTSGTSAVRYPKYDTLQFSNSSTGAVQAASNTLALAQDQYGDLFVADLTSRVAVYYQGLVTVNGASFFVNSQLSPGQFGTICPLPSASATAVCDSSSLANKWGTAPAAQYDWKAFPIGTTLGDMQVLFNGTPAPLYYTSPTQVNFLVPQNAPTSGAADVIIQQASTGQVFGAGMVSMNAVAPAIFTLEYTGTFRQAAVLNQDNTVNSKTNPAARGSVIQIYATGQGVVSHQPADGVPVNDANSTTPQTPRVLLGTGFVDSVATLPGDPTDGKWVKYSGLAPGLPGMWQINVQIPMSVAPGQQPLAIVYNGIGSADINSPYHTYIYVK
jgi:uncharacterized protein (TIGR03437 family)